MTKMHIFIYVALRNVGSCWYARYINTHCKNNFQYV